MIEKKRDEQSSNAAVAIKKGMDGLELRVRDPRMHQNWESVVLVQKLLEVTECVPHLVYRRGHECGALQGDEARADPILRCPKRARFSVGAANIMQEDTMNFTDESQ
jgi:hypothetical protein